MKESTNAKYELLLSHMAQSYGVKVEKLRHTFAITEPKETILNAAIQDSSDFLQRISVLPVVDKIGQSVNVNIHSTLAKRTDTSSTDRTPVAAGGPDGLEYKCELTEFDIAFDYALLDAWARFDNFEQMYMQAVYKRIALDRILIGFHGTSAATATNNQTNKELQDVNIGWLKLIEDNSPENFLIESAQSTGVINLGAAGEYKNLDQLVYDVYQMIPTASRTFGEVAIVGRALVAHDMGKALAAFGQRPTEKNEVMVLDKSYGALPSMVVPGFPDNGLLVTDPKNLHLYYQEKGTRRTAMDYPQRNQVRDYISSNDAYCLGDKKGAAAIKTSALTFKEA